jgi:hypothetical protein
VLGQYRWHSDTLRLNPRYLARLSDDDALDLLDTMVHELLHKASPLWKQLRDSFRPHPDIWLNCEKIVAEVGPSTSPGAGPRLSKPERPTGARALRKPEQAPAPRKARGPRPSIHPARPAASNSPPVAGSGTPVIRMAPGLHGSAGTPRRQDGKIEPADSPG